MLEPQTTGSPTSLDYGDVAPSHWQDALIQTRESGNGVVRSRVLWGAHEQVRGMRDFTKSSRLRLERFLGLAHSQGLTVELEIGFPPLKDAFPAWTKSVEPTATVPSPFWENGHDGFGYTVTPSLFDKEVVEGFESFVEEVVALCQLYQQPEGPISKIWLDLGTFHADCQSMDYASFGDVLVERYANIAALNLVYQTSFRSFDSFNLKSSYRVLLDRRAWIAAYDFQWCRRQMLARIESRLVSRFPSLSPLSRSSFLGTKETPWEIVMDATLLEVTTDGRKIFPCLPGGVLSPLAVHSFRLADYLAAHARREGTEVHLAHDFQMAQSKKKLLTVICGKYLSRENMTRLESFLNEGGSIFFPFGAPLYDQNLSSWALTSEKAPVVGNVQKLCPRQRGKGTVWLLSRNLVYDELVWDQLKHFCNEITQGALP